MGNSAIKCEGRNRKYTTIKITIETISHKILNLGRSVSRIFGSDEEFFLLIIGIMNMDFRVITMMEGY
jgi:hypothetical protein